MCIDQDVEIMRPFEAGSLRRWVDHDIIHRMDVLQKNPCVFFFPAADVAQEAGDECGGP